MATYTAYIHVKIIADSQEEANKKIKDISVCMAAAYGRNFPKDFGAGTLHHTKAVEGTCLDIETPKCSWQLHKEEQEELKDLQAKLEDLNKDEQE
jgi:hypothetical protein